MVFFEIPPYTGSRVPQRFSDLKISANLAEFRFGVSSKLHVSRSPNGKSYPKNVTGIVCRIHHGNYRWLVFISKIFDNFVARGASNFRIVPTL